jgi:hypothetical protein
MRRSFGFAAAFVVAATAASAQTVDVHVIRQTIRNASHAYQGRDRGPEQTDRFTGKYKIGRDGRVSVANISGDIVVTGGSGDEVSVDAVKRTRGDRSTLADVQVQVDNAPTRVEIRTEYPGRSRTNVSVDYTIGVPNGASVELHSVSGSIKVTGVRGAVRIESISGGVTASDTPNVELAKTVSGDVSLSGIATDGNVTAGTVSGTITAKGLKAKRLDLNSVSGDMTLTDVNVASVHAKAVSGSFEYTGALQKGGDYDVNMHSGTIRFSLANPSGFYLNADTFSGAIRTDFPVTIGGNNTRDDNNDGSRRGMRMGQSIRGSNGDGSATLTLRTFSGSIVIAKR